MNTTATRNYPLIFIRTVTWILMLMAAFISASHIVHVSQSLGLNGWYAYTTPAFIDLIAIAGKLSMLKRFDAYPEFQRSGRWMLIAGGTLSLAANIGAGANWGERAYGVLIVGGFLLLENHLTKAAGKTTEVAAPNRKLDPQVAAERAAKARVTREENKRKAMTPAQKAAATRARKAAEPVSPAWAIKGKPTAAEVAAIAS